MEKSSLTLENTIKRKDSFISSDLEESVVMMDVEKGQYYSLNKVGARIWEMLEQPIAISDICNQLIVIYSIPIEQCQKEVIEYTAYLAELDIIEVV